jgi:hypothetical protein
VFICVHLWFQFLFSVDTLGMCHNAKNAAHTLLRAEEAADIASLFRPTV